MKFLYHLTRVFRHFTDRNEIPFVKFQQIPNISNARWNSRAILALLAFILMPENRNRLRKIFSFISYSWAPTHGLTAVNCSALKVLMNYLQFWMTTQQISNAWKPTGKQMNLQSTLPEATSAVSVQSKLCKTCTTLAATRTTSHWDSSCPMTLLWLIDFLVCLMTLCNVVYMWL